MQKTGSHMLGVFISGTYRQTCSLSGSINLNWMSTSICLIFSRLQLLLYLMWHTRLTGLPATLRHVAFLNITLCGTITTATNNINIIIRQIKISQILLSIGKWLSETLGENSQMEVKLMRSWSSKKANSECALAYLYFWKQMPFPLKPKYLCVFLKYTHEPTQGGLCMFP